ncbi:hypothetical protein CDAR_607901 [Caerostris darwini]|uniref:Uncharacterized protein n=1 Tax=Caerostris darwini TaxID=1538125 RepID=A0AAV4ULA4_9ARAC|nr:hypothetical protein CDAR_607901 [Caerostris darwini]
MGSFCPLKRRTDVTADFECYSKFAKALNTIAQPFALYTLLLNLQLEFLPYSSPTRNSSRPRVPKSEKLFDRMIESPEPLVYPRGHTKTMGPSNKRGGLQNVPSLAPLKNVQMRQRASA